MSVQAKTHIILPSAEKDIIVRNEWLTDIHMDCFGRLLQNYSDYKPIETWRLQCLDTIQPLEINKKHIQILYSFSNQSQSDGHWVCSYYDTKNIFIYDSLNKNKLHEKHKQFLQRLFPFFPFDNYSVRFPIVQQQPNGSDCGVFAIAFAVSLLFNIKPEKVKYDHKLMRSHLIKIFESNVIEHFPQDPSYGISQKVLPLALVKQREIDAARMRVTRSINKAKNKKCNTINETFNMCQSNIESDKSQQNILIESRTIVNDNVADNSYIKKNSINNKRKTCDINNCSKSKHIKITQNKTKVEENVIEQECYQRDLDNRRIMKQKYYANNIESNRAKKRKRHSVIAKKNE